MEVGGSKIGAYQNSGAYGSWWKCNMSLPEQRGRWKLVEVQYELTRTAGHMEVGGSAWSLNTPRSHSGFTCDAHLLCS